MQGIERALPFVAAWGVWILVALLGGVVWGVWRLGRGRRWLVPAGWGARIASGALIVIAMVLGVGLWFATVGPLGPVLADVRSIRGTVGRPARELEFRLVADDTPRSLGELRGNVVLVNLWATWCPPCREEMPGIDRLQRDYGDRGLVVVTLSNETRERLLAFSAQHPLGTLNAYATDLGWLEVPGRPVTLVIDRAGVVRECIIGARSYHDFETLVTKYLQRA
jgi:thiol-disulfide isomerase/thioredoxin